MTDKKKRPTRREVRAAIDDLRAETGDDPGDDTFEVEINHVRVDLPEAERVDPDGVDDDTADGGSDGSDEAPDRSGAVVVDDDFEHMPGEVRASYRFNPKTGRYDIPTDRDDAGGGGRPGR